jgi:FG-GAP-like repeat
MNKVNIVVSCFAQCGSSHSAMPAAHRLAVPCHGLADALRIFSQCFRAALAAVVAIAWLLVSGVVYAQSIEWTQRYNGSSTTGGKVACGGLGAHHTGVDTNGNIFVTGCVTNGESSSTILTYKISASTGAVMWTTNYVSASGFASPAGLIVDASGNVVITATTNDGVSNGSENIRTIKYNGATGAEIWNVVFDGASQQGDGASALVLDGNGDVFVAGSSTTPNGVAMQTIKYSGVTGAQLWAVSKPAAYPNRGSAVSAIAVNASGDVAITGRSGVGLRDDVGRTVKYRGTDGVELWSATFGGVYVNSGNAVAMDAAGHVFITGLLSTSQVTKRVRTIKYDSATGTELWHQDFGDETARPEGRAIKVDAAGDVLVAGDIAQSAASGASRDRWTLKYGGTDGALLWTASYSASSSETWAMALDANGNPVVSGYSDDGGTVSGRNIRTIKYSSTNGSELWNLTNSATSNVITRGGDVVVDLSGNVIVTGSPQYSAADSSLSTIRSIKYDGATNAVSWVATQSAVPTAASVNTLGVLLDELIGRRVAVDNVGNVAVVGQGLSADGRPSFRTLKYDGFTGAVTWSAEFSSSGSAFGLSAVGDVAYGIAVDAAGNVFVTGASDDAVGARNMRTIKYDGVTGVELWNVSYVGTGSGDDVAYSIAVDAAGNPVITGVSIEATGYRTIRTIKYSGTNGAVVWSSNYDGTTTNGDDLGYAVAIDAANNVVVTGFSTDAAGARNMRTIKYNGTSGAQLWAAGYNSVGNGDDRGYAITTDSANNVIVTGVSGTGTNIGDIRTIKYAAATGTELWNKVFAGAGNGQDIGYAIAVDRNNDVVITGSSSDTVGGFNMRTIKYAATTGAELWNVTKNSGGDNLNGSTALAIDANNDVIITGTFIASVTADNRDLAVVKYSGTTGAELWTQTYAGSAGSNDVGYGVATGRNGAVFVFGTSKETNKPTGLFLRKFRDGAVARVANDLNADGKSDIIFNNTSTGEVAAWLMNGPSVTSAALLLGPGAWTTTHNADFNGDGKADILLRNNSNGTVVLWLVNGLGVTSGTTLVNAGSGWSVSHTGDFNGDGKADILWRHTDGSIVLWLMDGSTIIGAAVLLPANTGYSAVHVADFNGDGKTDIMLRNTSNGTVVVWTMNGVTVSAGATILGPNSGYSPTHTGDFNGDGKADILWRNNVDGSIVAWLMNGSAVITDTALRGPDAWYVNQVADFNGDGKADILLRNVDGRIVLWLMNGTTILSGTTLFGPTTAWAPAKTGDYNGDGKADIIMRNNDGTLVMWLMNGGAITSGSTILGPGFWNVAP